MSICKAPPVHWWIESGDDQSGEFYRQTLEWVTSLGLDPARLAGCRNGAYPRRRDRPRRVRQSPHPLDEDNLLRSKIVSVEEDSWPSRPADTLEVAS
jgi:hypothetical protein